VRQARRPADELRTSKQLSERPPTAAVVTAVAGGLIDGGGGFARRRRIAIGRRLAAILGRCDPCLLGAGMVFSAAMVRRIWESATAPPELARISFSAWL
jgi:hypothetical protein